MTTQDITAAANAATVTAIYESFGNGDIAGILERLAPDVAWDADAREYGLPWLTPRHGRAEVGEFFATLAAFDFRRFDIRSVLAGGDDVAVVIDVELHVRATGRTIVDREVHLWTFGPDGRVAAFRHVVDTHQHVLAAS